MDTTLKEATFEDLERENPRLLESISKAVAEKVRKELKESTENKEKEERYQKTLKENEEFRRERKLFDQKSKVQEMLKESKAVDAVKERVLEAMSGTLYETEEKLQEAYKTTLKKELDYANKFSSKGRITAPTGDGGSTDGSLKESLGAELDKGLGICEEKKDDK